MKLPKLSSLYASSLLLIVGLIVLHAPMSVYFGSILPEASLWIKVWKETVLVFALFLMILLVTRKKAWKKLWNDWLIRFCTFYGVLHVLLMIFLWQGAAPSLAGIAIDLRYILIFILSYVLIYFYPEYASKFKKISIIGAVIVVGFACLQISLPPDHLRHIGYGKSTIEPYQTIDQNPNFIRHNSTLRGPNPLGAYAASVLILIAAAMSMNSKRRKNVWLWLLGIGAAAAVYISYARSAILAVLVGLAAIALLVYGKRIRLMHWGFLAVCILAGALMFSIFKQNSFISNVVLHEDPAESGTYNSNDEHLDSLANGVRRMADQPFGAGIGSTGSASLRGDKSFIVENQYLFIAHESGWLGLGLFLAIFALILKRLGEKRRTIWTLGLFASGVGLAIAGLFLPIWADDTVSLVWWSLVGVILASSIGRNHYEKRAVTN